MVNKNLSRSNYAWLQSTEEGQEGFYIRYKAAAQISKFRKELNQKDVYRALYVHFLKCHKRLKFTIEAYVCPSYQSFRMVFL